jgi:hypothetical protein
MKTFDAPGPIALDVDMGIGELHVIASDRVDATVDVQPANPASKADANAAAQTTVELTGRQLVVKAPRSWKQWTPWGGRESLDIRVELPAGSDVRASTGLASLHASGPLGDCVYKAGIGDVRVDEASSLSVKTASGEVQVGTVQGDAEIATSSGRVHVGHVEGAADLKSSNGDVSIDSVSGHLRAVTSNGRISVESAGAGVTAKTAYGDIRVGRVRRDRTEAQTSFGKVEIGVAEGVTAWLDLDTHFGTIHNALGAADEPGPDAVVVEIQARSSYGSIAVHRVASTTAEVGRP